MPEIPLIDSDLVGKLRAGDSSAFEALFEKYYARLYYFSLRYMKQREDAEEIVQDIFVKIWEHRDRLDEMLSFSSYLFTIARNTIFNINRKTVNELAYYEYLKHFLELTHNKTENEIIYRDLKVKVDEIVDTFPKKRKKIFLLSREQGLSYKEIAEELSISEKTVEAHIYLALKTIKQTIDFNFILPLILMSWAN